MLFTILTFLLLLPLGGAILVWLVPPHSERWIRPLALTTAGATILAALEVGRRFDATQGDIQLLEKLLGNYYLLGVDGFSLPLVLLTTALSWVALLASGNIRTRRKGYYLAVLFLECAVLGVFLTQDWSFFYICWELTLIPLFFLINNWGGEQRLAAALNFILYTMGGSVFMLIALLIAVDQAEVHSFAMPAMQAGLRGLPRESQILIFLGFFIGFGVKIPIFPLHGWLALAYVQAPSPVNILLSGVLLKMGIYGLIRAAIMLPQALLALRDVLAALALINLLYGGLLAWRQSDLKALIAYSSFSHMGIALLGIAALNPAGWSGALMQMVAHGVVVAALFLLIGGLIHQTQTRDARDYGGLLRVTPRFALFITLAFMGAVGIPGTAGFIAELHVLIGALQRFGAVAGLLGVGMMISAAYATRTVGQLFLGPLRPGLAAGPDLQHHELWAAGILALAIIILGVAPAPLLQLVAPSIGHFQQFFVGY